MNLLSILSCRVGCWCFRGFRWVEVETWSHHVQSVGVYFVNLSLGAPPIPTTETLGGFSAVFCCSIGGNEIRKMSQDEFLF